MGARKNNKQSKQLRKLKENSICNSNVQTMLRLKQQQEPLLTKEQLDLVVIDVTLRELFNDGDKVVKDFKKDILEKYNIYYDDKMIERFWDILDATNLVNPVVGFGNTDKLNLSTEGYNLMLKFGSYKNFVQSMMQPAIQQMQAMQQTVAKPKVEEITPPSEENIEETTD